MEGTSENFLPPILATLQDLEFFLFQHCWFRLSRRTATASTGTASTFARNIFVTIIVTSDGFCLTILWWISAVAQRETIKKCIYCSLYIHTYICAYIYLLFVMYKCVARKLCIAGRTHEIVFLHAYIQPVSGNVFVRNNNDMVGNRFMCATSARLCQAIWLLANDPWHPYFEKIFVVMWQHSLSSLSSASQLNRFVGMLSEANGRSKMNSRLLTQLNDRCSYERNYPENRYRLLKNDRIFAPTKQRGVVRSEFIMLLSKMTELCFFFIFFYQMETTSKATVETPLSIAPFPKSCIVNNEKLSHYRAPSTSALMHSCDWALFTGIANTNDTCKQL